MVKIYYFISIEEFEDKIEDGEFFEYANVHGNYYGTLNSEIDKYLKNGIDIILEIDVQGALIAKTKRKDSTLIFMKAPTLKELEKRLRERSTEDEAHIQKRLLNALDELKYESQYDRVIVNHDIDQACIELMDIIKEKKVKKTKIKISVDDLLKRVPNKYELAILAGKAARFELKKGTAKSKIMNKVFKGIVREKVKLDYKD